MGRRFFWFFLLLFFLAIFIKEDFVLILLYCFIGVYLVSRWWGGRALAAVSIRRDFETHAFIGEQKRIDLHIVNRGWLPLAWLQIRDSLPVGLGTKGPFQQVASLGSKASISLTYSIECVRRGYFPIGPLTLASGDVLGAAPNQTLRLEPDYLTVYPKVIPLSNLDLPARSPQGTLHHRAPIFEDPSRILGKRDYVRGDSLRRVDWKATAASGRLQVKQFEPSIDLEAMIYLDLDEVSYNLRLRSDMTELAITVAASIANWVIGARQSVGLATNGIDPQARMSIPSPILPRRGRNQLLHILEMLARVEISNSFSLLQLLTEQINRYSWGTTLLVITGNVNEALVECLFKARFSGLNAVLIQCGYLVGFAETRQKARYFGFPVHQVINENDLDIWRR